MEAEEEAVFRQMFAALVSLRDRLRNQSPRSASILIEQANDAMDAAKRLPEREEVKA
ncbi:hypothetical protein LCGC14_2583050 [marine sediment metagenome]|uniref:Uncharacterized protein n=2 Tax=marine sediment metagenome TaxID=412755 RepID=A0A0F9D6P2_9ZZZZ